LKLQKKSKVNENAGNYTITGEYCKGSKVISGSVSIRTHAISFIETVDFTSEETN
jgi:hypothetical protein